MSRTQNKVTLPVFSLVVYGFYCRYKNAVEESAYFAFVSLLFEING